jgi:CBS domain containing-hemolysin-like protein
MPALPRALAAVAATFALLAPGAVRASVFAGETLDAVADWIAIVVLIVVPVVAIVVFWLIHVLPERFAEKRHHPQAQAIQVLCLLSLLFGGLLWPLAWLWAFTRPILYKSSYGTDKHEDWHEEMGEKAKAGKLLEHELEQLRQELDAMAARGALPANLRELQAELAKVQPRPRPQAEGGAA